MKSLSLNTSALQSAMKQKEFILFRTVNISESLPMISVKHMRC
jgi:hypothetical protein